VTGLRSPLRAAVVLVGVLAVVLPTAVAQTLEPIEYEVSFPAPETHYVEIEATVPTGGQAQVELMMPVWTPGSYLVREHARHVEGVAARDGRGRTLSVEKTQKNRWMVATAGVPAVTLSYRVYAREMSVRTNWVEDRFALLNGAPTFMTLVDSRPRPHQVRLVLPPSWAQTRTALPETPGGRSHHYSAPDFDTLVDSPIVAGNPAVYEFRIDGTPHDLVNVGEAGVWEGAKAAGDLEKIVRAAREMWGALPYDRYLFLNLITEGGGGLEHKNSSVLMTNRWATRTHSAYVAWLGLAAHELFHAWNIKRLRPVELGPFDYENENHTRSLWIAEGFTEYYADQLLLRAGLVSDADYLRMLSSNIESVQRTPGRLVQAVEMASFDAWIKYYRPDENSSNTSINYYAKGAVLAFLLDARIRRATDGARTLDDVMRVAYQRYSGSSGYTPEQFEALVAGVAGPGAGVREWFARAVESPEELEYDEALDWFGLRFSDVSETPGAWLGVRTRADAGRLLIAEVRRGGPAERGGLNVDDEILAIDEFRVEATRLQNRLARYRPGDAVSVLVSRRGELRRLDVRLGEEPPRHGALEMSATASSEQRERREAWLGSR